MAQNDIDIRNSIADAENAIHQKYSQQNIKVVAAAKVDEKVNDD